MMHAIAATTWRDGVLATLVFALASATWVGLRSYRAESLSLAPLRGGKVLVQPDIVGLPSLEEVTFIAVGGEKLSGWFVLPKNGGTIVLLHGTGADRSSLSWEIGVLARAGFGILAFDWPGHGRSEGTPDWGRRQRTALVAAVDWLVAHRGVDGHRIGALGFSNGGYVLVQFAALDPRLKGIVLAATPTDMIEQTRWEYRRYGPLSQIPAELALRWSGAGVKQPSARRMVALVSPRPVLIVGGGADRTVPETMLRDLYAAAREPKQLWIAPNAQHGRIHVAAPDEYRTKLVEFFRHVLLG